MTSEPMSDAGGGFLSRWSRRKQAERTRPAAAEPAADPGPELPPVEQLGAESDYRAFLQKGVAAAVQAQALHKAWTSDAAIAGFRGMADYDWDFNATGYGRMWATDNVPKLLEAILAPPVDDGARAEASVPAAPDPPTVRQTVIQAGPAPVVAAEPELDEQVAEAPAPRRHGSALPT